MLPAFGGVVGVYCVIDTTMFVPMLTFAIVRKFGKVANTPHITIETTRNPTACASDGGDAGAAGTR